jgi:hypothetical protein
VRVLHVQGAYAPARLAHELRAAGVHCAGVTCTERDGVVTGVDIICDDTATLPAIAAVTTAHDPNGPPLPVPTRDELEQIWAQSKAWLTADGPP